MISSPRGIEPLGGSGRKLFISTSFGGIAVPLPFEAKVEPEVWPWLGPRDSKEGLADIFGLSTVEYVSNATRGLERDSIRGLDCFETAVV